MNENNKNPRKRVVKVERDDFSFEKEFKEKHGKFVLKTNNIKAGRVKEFTLDDIELIDSIIGSPVDINRFTTEVANKGYVPLDVYCANALYKLIDNFEFIDCIYPGLPFQNIVFLGSTLSEKGEEDPRINSYAFFEYNMLELHPRIPKFVCSHNNPGTYNSMYVAAVFKKSFFNEKETVQTAVSKKEMPTLEQCQATVIKRLQKENEELKTRYNELLEKYNSKILKISQPKLSQEIEEFLCQKISDHKLSNRIKNKLDVKKISYLFQLVEFDIWELNKVSYLGIKSVSEIVNFLTKNKLSLGTKFSQQERNYFWKKVEKNFEV